MAKQGNAKGQFHLGQAYRTGKGITKDNVEAVKWYLKAAEKGYGKALEITSGHPYMDGRGVTQDSSEAIKWFRRAAERGDALAQSNLGGLYADDRNGVERDYIKTYKWLSVAENSGDPESSRTRIFFLEPRMTPSQIFKVESRQARH